MLNDICGFMVILWIGFIVVYTGVYQYVIMAINQWINSFILEHFFINQLYHYQDTIGVNQYTIPVYPSIYIYIYLSQSINQWR